VDNWTYKGDYFMANTTAPRPVDSVLAAIGNTPLVKLAKLNPPNSADVYVKLEYYNPTGSYKDRMALAMIEEAEKRGDLRPGMTVVEYTGGSTGSSLAFVCAVKGYPINACLWRGSNHCAEPRWQDYT
jgi:cysteine synthase